MEEKRILAERIYNVLYDMATEGECPTVEVIGRDLLSTRGTACLLESLVQFLTGDEETKALAMEIIHLLEQDEPGTEDEDKTSTDYRDPCEVPDENGFHHCPYEDYGGYESERCRVCCGHGVDE